MKVQKIARRRGFLRQALLALAVVYSVLPSVALSDWKSEYLEGLDFYNTGKWSQAYSKFQKAIQDNPKENRVRLYGLRYGDYTPYLLAGESLLQLKRYEEATKYLEKSQSIGYVNNASQLIVISKRKALETSGSAASLQAVAEVAQLKKLLEEEKKRAEEAKIKAENEYLEQLKYGSKTSSDVQKNLDAERMRLQKEFDERLQRELEAKINANAIAKVVPEKSLRDSSQKRVALVVGNAEYTNVTKLKNPLNDASDLSNQLRKLDFDVIEKNNIRTKGGFKRAVRVFRDKLAQDKNTVGMFFYAGHAVQVNGVNYLIPTESEVEDEYDLEDQAIELSFVTEVAHSAKNLMNMFYIDACRDNPFRSLSRSMGRGLASETSPEGSVIVFATNPGNVAKDGEGRNSPFTKSLLKHINTPNKHVLLMLQDVGNSVKQDTDGSQQPWVQYSLNGSFYFK